MADEHAGQLLNLGVGVGVPERRCSPGDFLLQRNAAGRRASRDGQENVRGFLCARAEAVTLSVTSASAMNFSLVCLSLCCRCSAATRRQSRERIYHEGKKGRCISHTTCKEVRGIAGNQSKAEGSNAE
jgi:hypothetical protein